MNSQANSNAAAEGGVYTGTLMDRLFSAVNTVVPVAAPPEPSCSGLLLTIDEVLERIDRAAH